MYKLSMAPIIRDDEYGFQITIWGSDTPITRAQMTELISRMFNDPGSFEIRGGTIRIPEDNK